LLRPEAAERGIEIVTRAAEGLPPIPADAAQLTQSLVNLVINAIQAVEHDGRVEVNATLDTTGGWLSIAVRDSGPGIPAGRESAIFEPFYTTKSDGSGLGLWIVQQIVTAHGGEVAAANAPGGGAVFTVHLPQTRKELSHG
jgi:two-component system sensor histidine kinase HydH